MYRLMKYLPIHDIPQNRIYHSNLFIYNDKSYFTMMLFLLTISDICEREHLNIGHNRTYIISQNSTRIRILFNKDIIEKNYLHMMFKYKLNKLIDTSLHSFLMHTLIMI